MGFSLMISLIGNDSHETGFFDLPVISNRNGLKDDSEVNKSNIKL